MTGLPASLDEELQTTLRKFRHQILQAMGGKGVPQGLTSTEFPPFPASGSRTSRHDKWGRICRSWGKKMILLFPDSLNGSKETEVDKVQLPMSGEYKFSA